LGPLLWGFPLVRDRCHWGVSVPWVLRSPECAEEDVTPEAFGITHERGMKDRADICGDDHVGSLAR
jgi:hypothetical protein